MSTKVAIDVLDELRQEYAAKGGGDPGFITNIMDCVKRGVWLEGHHQAVLKAMLSVWFGSGRRPEHERTVEFRSIAAWINSLS